MGRKRTRIEDAIGISLEVFPEGMLVEKPYDRDSESPKPEQVMIRQAVRYLTPKQREVWNLYNYDKLTQDEIAQKLGKKRTTIETQVHQCEARIVKWCKMNMETYKMIKQEMEKD